MWGHFLCTWHSTEEERGTGISVVPKTALAVEMGKCGKCGETWWNPKVGWEAWWNSHFVGMVEVGLVHHGLLYDLIMLNLIYFSLYVRQCWGTGFHLVFPAACLFHSSDFVRSFETCDPAGELFSRKASEFLVSQGLRDWPAKCLSPAMFAEDLSSTLAFRTSDLGNSWVVQRALTWYASIL